jgi:hypothetical protein
VLIALSKLSMISLAGRSVGKQEDIPEREAALVRPDLLAFQVKACG